MYNFSWAGDKRGLPPSKIPAPNVEEEICACVHMLKAKTDAGAIHPGGWTGCGVDPGPRGVGMAKIYVYWLGRASTAERVQQ